jgi:hypothetical protein
VEISAGARCLTAPLSSFGFGAKKKRLVVDAGGASGLQEEAEDKVGGKEARPGLPEHCEVFVFG